jgi:hypothetical protein
MWLKFLLLKIIFFSRIVNKVLKYFAMTWGWNFSHWDFPEVLTRVKWNEQY